MWWCVLLILAVFTNNGISPSRAFNPRDTTGFIVASTGCFGISRPLSHRRRRAAGWSTSIPCHQNSRHRHCSTSRTAETENDDDNPTNDMISSHDADAADTTHRRGFLRQVTALSTVSILSTLSPASVAHAMGLMKFPCTEPLHNIYHFMRAGTSLLEEQDIWSTNPLFLTNREAALSPQGRQQVLQAIRRLQEANIQPSQIRHSLAASAMDAAGLVRDELKVGQNRINPEFVFMDPRAIGAWESMSYHTTQAAVAALDDHEAGNEGREGRPPPNDDGTPNETLFDQSTRLRQLMSALETQYSGDTILLVFPDGTGPALLSAMIAGIPLNQVHVLDYQPGELRIDVTPQSTLDLFREKQRQQGAETYSALIQRGEEELQRLRSLDASTIVNKKDQLLQQEQLAIEREYRRKKEAQRKKEEEAKEARLARQQELEKARRKKEEEAERVRLAKRPPTNTEALPTQSVDPTLTVGGLIAGAVIGGVSMLAFGTNDDSDENIREKGSSTQNFEAKTEIGRNANSTSTLIRGNDQVDKAKPIGNTLTPDQTTERRTSSLYARPLSPSPPPLPPTEEERIEAARVAMDEYMNKDDGVEDWLQMMNQIMEDEEVDTDDGEDVVEIPSLSTHETSDQTPVNDEASDPSWEKKDDLVR